MGGDVINGVLCTIDWSMKYFLLHHENDNPILT